MTQRKQFTKTNVEDLRIVHHVFKWLGWISVGSSIGYINDRADALREVFGQYGVLYAIYVAVWFCAIPFGLSRLLTDVIALRENSDSELSELRLLRQSIDRLADNLYRMNGHAAPYAVTAVTDAQDKPSAPVAPVAPVSAVPVSPAPRSETVKPEPQPTSPAKPVKKAAPFSTPTLVLLYVLAGLIALVLLAFIVAVIRH